MPRHPDAVRQAFGKEVRARRLAQGRSQEALALDAGLSLRHVSELERGLKTPSLLTVLAVARALGCRPGDLVNPLAEP